MALIKTANPALSENTFRDFAGPRLGELAGASPMTLSGTVNKTGILLLCAVAGAAWTWRLFVQAHQVADIMPYLLAGTIGGFLCAMVTIFKQQWSPVTAPIYALLEGLALGGLSAVFDLRYPGIAFEAVGLTFATLFVLLLLYSSGLIKVTQKLRMGIVAATGGVMVFYLAEMVLGFFHVNYFASVNSSSPVGIGFSLVVVAIASLNLVLDFDFIEQGVASGAPKYMEWYGAFGIMVTLVWLYLEMLRLLSKVRSR